MLGGGGRKKEGKKDERKKVDQLVCLYKWMPKGTCFSDQKLIWVHHVVDCNGQGREEGGKKGEKERKKGAQCLLFFHHQLAILSTVGQKGRCS